MAAPFPPHPFDTPPTLNNYHDQAEHDDDDDDEAEHLPSRPLSGPGTSRQTRRLQLRNTGFRAAAVPTRKATPKSAISSSNWSSVSGVHGSSDVENVSPSGPRLGSEAATGSKSSRRRSSGILQEIGNSSTLMRPKKTRPRLSSSKLFASDALGKGEEGYFGLPTSPPPPTALKTTIRPRTVKNRAKVSHRRRSVSAETSKYIEHLECELAATQSQLSTITSPSVTREQSTKLRTLNAETRQLHEEIADWEAKYEERVQEEVDRHCEVEGGLRARIRNLELDAQETRLRVQELETQVESAAANLEAVEAANVNLERRLEIMSELLAASPSKIDLHAQTPVGRGGRRHIRPKSMLPRFPTASSLMGSPERQPHTQPVSPVLLNYTPSVASAAAPESPSFRSLLSLDTTPPPHRYQQQPDYVSDAESIFSEAEVARPASSTEHNYIISSTAEGYFPDTQQRPNYNRWSLPPVPLHNSKAPKPPAARRMRKFGAGSAGPKPLILPSTSAYEILLSPATSAPPLERSETAPALFFPDVGHTNASSAFGSRRRASTEADAMTRRTLEASPFPFLDVPASPQQLDTDTMTRDDMSVMQAGTPPSLESQATTTRRYSSLGSVGGRNLMEELDAARSDETAAGSSSLEQRSDFEDGQSGDPWTASHLSAEQNFRAEDASHIQRDIVEEEEQHCTPLQQELPKTSLIRSSNVSSSWPNHGRNRSSSSLLSGTCSPSIFHRLRILFGDLWRSPVALARHLVQAAQLRMLYIPAPLRNAQWWLVGVLLGPMAARRRMISRSHSPSSSSSSESHQDADDDPERGPLLIKIPTLEEDEEDALAYGTLYTSPPASPARKASSSGMTASKGKKRKTQSRHYYYCPHHSHRRKHSPWLWLKFSLTLAFAVGIAFKDGPGSLLKRKPCACRRREELENGV